jgi:hypothetical protein
MIIINIWNSFRGNVLVCRCVCVLTRVVRRCCCCSCVFVCFRLLTAFQDASPGDGFENNLCSNKSTEIVNDFGSEMQCDHDLQAEEVSGHELQVEEVNG